MKPLIYRCVNLLVSSLALYEGAIDGRSVLHKETYRVFCADTVRRLKNLAGEFVTPDAVPALRLITWVRVVVTSRATRGGINIGTKADK